MPPSPGVAVLMAAVPDTFVASSAGSRQYEERGSPWILVCKLRLQQGAQGGAKNQGIPEEPAFASKFAFPVQDFIFILRVCVYFSVCQSVCLSVCVFMQV